MTAIPYQDHGLLESLWPVKGQIWGSSHWQSCTYSGHGRSGETVRAHGYVDLSVKEKIKGVEYHPIYIAKEPGESWTISFACSAATFVYTPIVIAYHILRMIVVTLYLVGRLLFYDPFVRDKKESYGALALRRIVQIAKEDWRSLSTIIRTPICALGFLLSHVYTMFFDSMQWTHGDGLNGRKMAAYFEKAWNRWVPLDKSVWYFTPARDFEFEGGGDPDKMGQYALYLPGCYQPVAYAQVTQGKITDVITEAGRFVFHKDPKYTSLKPLKAESCC